MRKAPCRFAKKSLKGMKCRRVGRGKRRRLLCCRKKSRR